MPSRMRHSTYVAHAPKGFDKVKLLIERNADVNAQNNDGDTPLHSAMQAGNFEMTVLLIANGADVAIVNNHKMTPLDYGMIAFDQSPLIKALFVADLKGAQELLASWYYGEKQFNQEQIDELNRSFLLAAALGNDPIIDTLVKHFSTYLKSQTLKDALIAAVSRGHYAVVHTLVNLLNPENHLLNADEFSTVLEDALYWAAINRQSAMIDLILHVALINEIAPHLRIGKTRHYITSLLDRSELKEKDREVLTAIDERLRTVLISVKLACIQALLLRLPNRSVCYLQR